ncbi:MAG: cell division protein ZapA [Candidatus Babeliales bacterium]
MQKHIRITINGKQYSIATDEDETDVQNAAQLLDGLLRDKTEKLPPGDEQKAMFAIALQLATELVRNRRKLQIYDERVERLITVIDTPA